MNDELIVSDPDILGGTPCIVSTRLPVYAVLARFRAGETAAEILDGYPDLSAAHVMLPSPMQKRILSKNIQTAGHGGKRSSRRLSEVSDRRVPLAHLRRGTCRTRLSRCGPPNSYRHAAVTR